MTPCRYPFPRIRNSFNPHTHEGCDIRVAYEGRIIVVSIHTPTKGVTSYWYRLLRCFVVSIHTPTKGVTCTSCLNSMPNKFQSTHPRRVWLNARMFTRTMPMFQSTHPRRVWRFVPISIVLRDGFQSTHPRRVWLNARMFTRTMPMFQSTHPRRVWLVVRMVNHSFIVVSIHTPTKGVTC